MAKVQVRRRRIFEAVSCERLHRNSTERRYGREQCVLHRALFNCVRKLDLGRRFDTVLNDIFGLAGHVAGVRVIPQPRWRTGVPKDGFCCIFSSLTVPLGVSDSHSSP